MDGLPIKDHKKNVLIIVFDAFSAHNISLYGYGRKTTPNIDRLARRAIVYHNHYATSNFTTPGTASLLTGTYPWTHRAQEEAGNVAESFITRNIFTAFNDYFRIAYTHNSWVDIFLKQFSMDIEEWVPPRQLFLPSYDRYIPLLFARDSDLAAVSWSRNINIETGGFAYSLFLSRIFEAARGNSFTDLKKRFPRGLPSTGSNGSEFILENGLDWIVSRLGQLPEPFLGYFHFLPPHDPYRSSITFMNRFENDDFKPVSKPSDIFSHDESFASLLGRRAKYDEFILYVDQQFARFLEALEDSGLLANTWVVLTSDHGEMHERGISFHDTDGLYNPLIKIPLVIFEPGRSSKQDIYTSTSAVDLLPTLLHLTGHTSADWTEGAILPQFSDSSLDPDRNIYAVKADENRKYGPLVRASTVLLKERYKLAYYFGYELLAGKELVQLYDLKSDPEELNDLAATKPALASELLHELKQKLDEVNAPYMQTS